MEGLGVLKIEAWEAEKHDWSAITRGYNSDLYEVKRTSLESTQPNMLCDLGRSPPSLRLGFSTCTVRRWVLMTPLGTLCVCL